MVKKNEALNKLAANKKLVAKLKKSVPRDLDIVSSDLHDEIFAETDCLACANCCKTTSPIFYERDVERLAKRMNIRPSAFIDKYLHLDEDKDYVLNSAPCIFLDSENYCTVYDDRPNACREYPHTKRKRFHQVLELALKNTLVCPAVLKIMDKLRSIYG
jgi:uncharacterized protein